MNLKELVEKVNGEFRISQIKDLDFSYVKEIVEGWNLVAEDEENWKSRDLVSYGWKIRSIERLYASEHQDYIPLMNSSLLSYLGRMPRRNVVIKTKERLRIKGFTEEEIAEVEEYARRKLGYCRKSWESDFEVGQNFKVYLFFYEDLPSFFYREQKDDGILWFRISGVNDDGIYVRCIDIQLD
jgi:hypothetical protein